MRRLLIFGALALVAAVLGLTLHAQAAPEFTSYRAVVRTIKAETAPDADALRRVVDAALGETWTIEPNTNDAFEIELKPPAKVAAGAPDPRPRTAAAVWIGLHRLHAAGVFTRVEPVLSRAFPPQPGAATPWHGECERSWSGTPKNEPADGAFTDSTWSLGPRGANVFEAWKLSTGRGVTIAHPDTGYLLHPAVIPALLGRGFNFTSVTNDALDIADDGVLQWPGHGTRTGSVIAGRPYALSNHWISGAAPGAELMPLKVAHRVVLVDWLDYDVDQVARAIRAAAIGDPNFVRRKADIISMSLGGPSNKDALKEALAVAEAHNVIVLAAAGNEVPTREVVFPARFPNVIAVAASNYDGKNWDRSSKGASIAFAAPGQNVWTAKHRAIGEEEYDCIEPSSGTSYAVATSAGVAALWLSYHRQALDARPDIDRSKVFKALAKCTARSIDLSQEEQKKYGGGILDAAALLAEPLPGRDGPAPAQSPRCIRELRTVPPRPLVAS
jgi:hypothetical protein